MNLLHNLLISFYSIMSYNISHSFQPYTISITIKKEREELNRNFPQTR